MNLEIVIPTLNRKQKLINCISSIEKAKKTNNLTVFIYFSNYNDLLDFKKVNRWSWVVFHMVSNYKTTTFWNTHLNISTADAMVYINDDILFIDDTIDVIIQQFNDYFPDYDGILGLNQSNLYNSQKLDCAFGVIGLQYANRFPNRQVWCPEYHRFYGDKELGDYAKSIGKFKYCEDAKIIHLHPSIDYKQIDQTHLDVRQWLDKDKNTYFERKKLNYLWGNCYNLLNIRE